MITYLDFARAAFDNDVMANEYEFRTLFDRFDTTVDDVMNIADQRALRAVIIRRGMEEAQRIHDQAFGKTFSLEQLTDDEKSIFNILVATWVDGALTAFRVTKEKEAER